MDVDYTCKLNCTVLLKMNELASLWRLQLFKINKKNISVIQLHYYNINLLFTFLVFWDLALKKKEIQVLNKTEKRFLPLAEQHMFQLLACLCWNTQTTLWCGSHTRPGFQTPPAAETVISFSCSFKLKCKENKLNS